MIRYAVKYEGRKPKYMGGINRFTLSDDIADAELFRTEDGAAKYLDLKILKGKGKVVKVQVTEVE